MGADGRIRIDKWLWHARFFRSRSLAAEAVGLGMRVNGRPCAKPAQPLAVGDVVTFELGARVWVVRVLAPGIRRGPATEATMLYEEVAP